MKYRSWPSKEISFFKLCIGHKIFISSRLSGAIPIWQYTEQNKVIKI